MPSIEALTLSIKALSRLPVSLAMSAWPCLLVSDSGSPRALLYTQAHSCNRQEVLTCSTSRRTLPIYSIELVIWLPRRDLHLSQVRQYLTKAWTLSSRSRVRSRVSRLPSPHATYLNRLNHTLRPFHLVMVSLLTLLTKSAYFAF